MLKMIAEKTRKKELAELRAILKKYLSQEPFGSEQYLKIYPFFRGCTKYNSLEWYQNIRPALKNGLIKCGYKIRWRPLFTESLSNQLTAELKAWASKHNPNRIYCSIDGPGIWTPITEGIDLIYNYKQG